MSYPTLDESCKFPSIQRHIPTIPLRRLVFVSDCCTLGAWHGMAPLPGIPKVIKRRARNGRNLEIIAWKIVDLGSIFLRPLPASPPHSSSLPCSFFHPPS